MRCVLLAGLLLFGAEAAAGDEAVTPAQAAARARALAETADWEGLATLARDPGPDPWLVVDRLCVDKRFDTAERFARSVPGQAAQLAAYVASQKGAPPDPEAFALVARALAAARAGRFEEAHRLVEARSPSGIRGVQVALVRGYAAYGLKAFGRAEPLFLGGADRAFRLGWRGGVLECLRQAAVAAMRDGRLPEAIRHWTRHAELAAAWGDPVAAARSTRDAGFQWQRLGEIGKAREHFGRALAMSERAKDRPGQLWAHRRRGHLEFHAGRPEAARESLNAGLELALALKDVGAVEFCRAYLWRVYQNSGRFREAIEHGTKGLALAEKHDRAPAIAGWSSNLGLSYYGLGEYREALRHLNRSLAVARRMGDRSAEARALINMGLNRMGLGQYGEALRSFERAAPLTSGADRAVVDSNMGLTYQRMGALRRALELQQRALAAHRANNNADGIATALMNLGSVHLHMGNFAPALRCLDDAGEIYERLKNPARMATLLTRKGQARFLLKEDERAFALYRRALELQTGIGNRAGIADTWADLGGLHLRRGELDAAQAVLTEALAQYRAIQRPAGEALALSNLARVHLRRNELPGARRTGQQALEIYTRLASETEAVRTRQLLAEVAWNEGKRVEALAAMREVRTSARSIPYWPVYILSSQLLAEYHLAQDDPRTAVEFARDAVEQVARVLGGLGDEEGAQAREEHGDLFETALAAAVAAGDVEQACRFMELGRAGALLEALGGGRAVLSATVPARLMVFLAKAREAVHAARAKERAAARAGDKDALARHQAAVGRAEATLERTLARVQREAKAAASVAYPRAKSVAEIQAALRDDEAFVQYALYDRAVALVLTRTDARLVQLGPGEPVREACRQLVVGSGRSVRGLRPRDTVRPEAAVQAATARLRDLVVAPLRLGNDAKRVVVSPHGILGYVPTCLLLPGRQVAHVDSATTLALLRAATARPGKGVLAVGDPATGLAPLPGARVEAKAVGSEVLLGHDATWPRVQQAIGGAPRWRSLHLACHGLIDVERPAFSALAFTPVEPRDGRLRALDLARTRVDADLVVLSACESGKGKVYLSEGIVGFTRAFMIAGAPRVIVSLWKVDDAATRALMVRFYELWNSGLGVAEALGGAQEFVRAQKRWGHPYFWAAWKLWGLPS
ncbi:MAG: CHAT domain-containing protein [Planctomycetota bacterium]|jgi:CHAT domain-containing protein/tetratricopeptide (TPR) repeat protein